MGRHVVVQLDDRPGSWLISCAPWRGVALASATSPASALAHRHVPSSPPDVSERVAKAGVNTFGAPIVGHRAGALPP